MISCQFAGWSYDGKVYSAGEALKNLASDDGAEVTLTAVWAPSSYNLPAAEKASHIFLGWFNDSTGTTLIGSAGTNISVDKDTEVWCGWKKEEFLESLGEEEFKEIIETIQQNETGKFSVDSIFDDGKEFDTLEEAIEHASECYKKEQADEVIGSFEEKLSVIGGSINNFEERRHEILSSITGDSQSGYRRAYNKA